VFVWQPWDADQQSGERQGVLAGLRQALVVAAVVSGKSWLEVVGDDHAVFGH
jgi:hypothetical protein